MEVKAVAPLHQGVFFLQRDEIQSTFCAREAASACFVVMSLDDLVTGNCEPIPVKGDVYTSTYN
jgi:hypothetical protein